MNKAQAYKLLDDTFNSEFNVLKFSIFLKELVNNSNLYIQDKTQFVENEFRDYILKVEKLGQYKDKAGKSMELLAIKLAKHSSLERARTMQRNFIARWLAKKSDEPEGAIVGFYDDEKDWRFSFVKLEYNLVKDNNGNLKTKKELTPAKRYSFLVGPNEPNYTCKKQFVELLSENNIDPSFDEIEKAFNIEKVTKEFFEEYKKRFFDLRDSLQNIIKNNSNVRTEFISISGEENLERFVVEFSKKLLGQIVFLYFLQKKGWLGVRKNDSGKFNDWGTGPKDFMKRLFKKEYCLYNNFFNDVLEPLFYNTLAIKRTDDFSDKFDCKIPFLNGGLFEPLDGYDWMNTNIYIENSIFEDIFSTFDTFNFTVKEDEPLEKEVAVDPEMLGKVFENLLEITDRKSKGAFYTPREIVHYMCQQSLINYLETNSNLPRTDIEKFIQEGDKYLDQTIKAQEHKKKYNGNVYDIDFEYVIPKSIEENFGKIDQLLKEIKVVDPAVGSGAFPVGMMSEIIKARSILSIYFEEDRDVSEMKRECIENSLYGVDIMPSAVDICQLRFWLSLVVDELDREKIKPLPNLDNKIMCGNSLLEEFEGVKLFDDSLLGEDPKDIRLELERIDTEINNIYLQIGKIETGKLNADKNELKEKIRKLEKEKKKIIEIKQIDSNITLTNFDKVIRDEAKVKLNKLKEKQKLFFNSFDRDTKKQLKQEINKLEWELIEATLKQQGNEEAIKKLNSIMKSKSKPFFLWKLYFSEVFERKNPGFDVVIGNPPYIDYRKIDDTTKRGLNNFEIYKITKTGSIYVYFIELGMSILRQNSILAYINPYQYLSADSGLGIRKLLIEKYFIKRIVDVSNIKVFAEASTYTCINLFIKNHIDDDIEMVRCDNLNELTKKGFFIKLELVRNDNYRIPVTEENKIISKVSRINTKLNDFCDTIFCGTSAGGFGKQIIKLDEFVKLSESKKEEYSLVIQSSNILKYFLKDLNNYIPKRIFPNNVQNNFKKEKIFFARMTKQIRCVLVSENYFGGKINVLTDFGINSKFLISILNSSLMSYWYYTKFESKHLAGGYLGFDIPSIKEMPIKEISEDLQKPFIKLVDQIVSITKDEDYLKNLDKQTKVKKLECEIDQMVYKLYDLSIDEIKIVEDSLK